MLAWLALAPAAALAQATPVPKPGCAAPETPARVASVAETGEFVLASGTRLQLADLLAFADGTRPPALARFLAQLPGERVLVSASAPNRWGLARGRLAIMVGAAARAIDLAELLVGEGLAVVDAGEQDALCQPALLGLEAAARAERRGLWAAADAPVLGAEDTAAVAARVGRFAIAEGRIVSVGERPQRVYLNLGRFGAGALTLTLPKRAWAAFRARGLSAESLRGRRVRARGIVEMWRGPMMEITVPDMLELIEPRAGETR